EDLRQGGFDRVEVVVRAETRARHGESRVDEHAAVGNLPIIERVDAEAREYTAGLEVDVRDVRLTDDHAGVARTTKRTNPEFAPAGELTAEIEGDFTFAYPVACNREVVRESVQVRLLEPQPGCHEP